MLVEVCKNPRNPGFNHYLFESVAALIRHGTAASPASIADYEAALFPAFELVLQQDVQASPAWVHVGQAGVKHVRGHGVWIGSAVHWRCWCEEALTTPSSCCW